MAASTDSLLYTYTQETTVHGIGRAASKEKSLLKRTCWVIFFLGCAALFLFFFCEAWILYFQFPVSTKFTYNTESALDFPSVTLCNYNKVIGTYLAQKNDPLLNATVAYLDSNGAQPLSEEVAAYMKTLDAEQFYREAAHPFESTFLFCTFVGIEVAATLEPGKPPGCLFPSGAVATTITTMGVCYTFQPQSFAEEHGVVTSRRAGSLGGLRLIVSIDQSNYRFAGFSAGMKVLVHDPKVTPRVLELGSGLEPGTEAYMVIKKNEMVNLPHPYGQGEHACLDTNASDYVNPLKYTKTYSYSACLHEQMVDVMLKFCQCVDFLFYVPDVPICDLYVVETCVRRVKTELFTNDSVPTCRKPCNDIQYDVSVSQSVFPNAYKTAALSQMLGVPMKFFPDNIISLNVYFGELGYTRIEQEPSYTFATAIAGIGGYMGLCLGASILTVFELFELFWDYIATCANKSSSVSAHHQSRDKDGGACTLEDLTSRKEKATNDYSPFQDCAK